MELLDIVTEIERYLAINQIDAVEISAAKLLEIMTDEGTEEF